MGLTGNEQAMIAELDDLYSAALKKLRFTSPGTTEYLQATEHCKLIGEKLHVAKDDLVFGSTNVRFSAADIKNVKEVRKKIESATKTKETINALLNAVSTVIDIAARIRSVIPL